MSTTPAGTGPNSQIAKVHHTEASCFQKLPDEVIGVIWRSLDQRSQHNFMLASKHMARNPSILAQIQSLSFRVKENALKNLLRFPSRAQLRRMHVTNKSSMWTCADFLNAAAGSRHARQLLKGLHELECTASAHIHCMGQDCSCSPHLGPTAQLRFPLDTLVLLADGDKRHLVCAAPALSRAEITGAQGVSTEPWVPPGLQPTGEPEEAHM